MCCFEVFIKRLALISLPLLKGELCLAEYAACEIVMGVIGGVAVVLSVVIIVAYRSYRYEQELDSLLWKIDPIELKVINYGDYIGCLILF